MSTNDPIKSLSPVTVDGPTRKLFDHIDRLEEQNAKLLAALEIPLLFHSSEPWTAERCNQWDILTGSTEATTKVMCDAIRAAIAKAKETN